MTSPTVASILAVLLTGSMLAQQKFTSRVESVSLKSKWATENGFRGVFFWQVNGDRLPDGTNPLQEAARRNWADTSLKPKTP